MHVCIEVITGLKPPFSGRDFWSYRNIVLYNDLVQNDLLVHNNKATVKCTQIMHSTKQKCSEGFL